MSLHHDQIMNNDQEAINRRVSLECDTIACWHCWRTQDLTSPKYTEHTFHTAQVTMAKIHQSIQGVLDFFDKYKGEDGVLDKKEFRAIIEKECKGNVDESVLEKLFDKLDQNKDGKLDMEEYSNIICLMIRASYYRRTYGGFGGGRCIGKGSCK